MNNAFNETQFEPVVAQNEIGCFLSCFDAIFTLTQDLLSRTPLPNCTSKILSNSPLERIAGSRRQALQRGSPL